MEIKIIASFILQRLHREMALVCVCVCVSNVVAAQECALVGGDRPVSRALQLAFASSRAIVDYFRRAKPTARGLKRYY